jgi:hypothetical protein
VFNWPIFSWYLFNFFVRFTISLNTTKPVHDNNDKQVEHQIREENNLLKQNLHVLENENEEMKEIIEELMENQEISTFEKGKYNDTVLS